MTNYIREHSKKFLAVLGVILMVAFILPSQTKYGEGGGSKYLVGYLGDRKVYSTDISRAKAQWEMLERYIVISPEYVNNQIVPLAEALRRNPAFSVLTSEMTTRPELFYLLQQEADRSGIVVLPGDMDQEFKRRRFAVRLQSGVIMSLDEITDDQFKEAIRDAGAAFSRVERSLNRAMFANKVSRPLREHEIARQLQQIQLEVVDFSTNDFLSQVPAPTSDDLKKQFESFADTLPERPPTPTNPHSFGYKFRNRVTLQYIAVPHDDVRKSVLASKEDWDLQARKYYLRNLPQFQTTQPTSRPSTVAAATLATTLAATQPASGPTTKPFEAVREEIVESLIARPVGAKARDIQDRINARLRADYDTWRAKNPNPQPRSPSSTQPATALAASAASGAPDFASFEYLQQVARDIEQQTGVLPVIASLNQLQSAKDLQSIPGIGQAMLDQVPFPLYATEFPAEFLPATERDKSRALQLYKPSQVLRDSAGSSYVIRLTSAVPTGRPNSLNEVADAVERDWKFASAYDLMKSRAGALLDAARQSSLASAAREANRKTVTTGLFDSTSRSIENISLNADALQQFEQAALGLLSTAASRPATPPLKLIELPVRGRIFVAQLLAAKPRVDTNALGMMDAMIENEIIQRLAEPVLRTWCSYDQVVARTGYKDQRPDKKS